MATVGSLGHIQLSKIASINHAQNSKIAAVNHTQFVTTVADSISLDYEVADFDEDGQLVGGNDYIQVTSSGLWTSAIFYNEGSGWAYRTPELGYTGYHCSITVDSPYYDYRTGYIRFTCGTAFIDFIFTQNK